jgi:phosphohistidine phosphatase
MKTLYIIRHAKSSWKFDFTDDQRPLALRGRRDVFRVGQTLSRTENTPDLMISSPASRALYTALFLGDEWGYPEGDIQIEKRLYHADSDEILEILEDQNDDINSIAIFGHNPGYTDLVNHFSDQFIDNVPTCGVFGFELKIDKWADIRHAKTTEKVRILPKRLPRKV